MGSSLVQTATGYAAAGASLSAGSSADTGVRYADGVVQLSWQDLSSDGFGTRWGQTRSWTNGAGYAANAFNGNGMVNTQMPFLVQTGTSVAVVTNGTDAFWFDLSGSNY